MKNKQTARKTIDAEKFNEMMEMVHTEHHRLKEVNEELLTQNKELNSLVDDQQEHFVNIAVRLGKYKGENEGFKRKIQKLEKENECLKEDMVRLEKENEKLKEHLDKAREVSNKLIGENNTTMPSQSALYRENEKLKEEKKNNYKPHFLDTYIVPNFYTPEDLGLKDDEVNDFKIFVENWALSGDCNEIMEELIENFREDRQEE